MSNNIFRLPFLSIKHFSSELWLCILLIQLSSVCSWQQQQNAADNTTVRELSLAYTETITIHYTTSIKVYNTLALMSSSCKVLVLSII